MRWGTLYRAALADIARAAWLAITVAQREYSMGHVPPRQLRLSHFYSRRARERLAEARRYV